MCSWFDVNMVAVRRSMVLGALSSESVKRTVQRAAALRDGGTPHFYPQLRGLRKCCDALPQQVGRSCLILGLSSCPPASISDSAHPRATLARLTGRTVWSSVCDAVTTSICTSTAAITCHVLFAVRPSGVLALNSLSPWFPICSPPAPWKPIALPVISALH